MEGPKVGSRKPKVHHFNKTTTTGFLFTVSNGVMLRCRQCCRQFQAIKTAGKTLTSSMRTRRNAVQMLIDR